ncbi:MAG TPA: sulfatase-like hydrolase/transferase [Chloroflexota bacterium]|nr:sulfatase-like hydrolase/transferase [Chloroflexota bacterium]
MASNGTVSTRPPNILLIMSDEHGPMFSSAYGHSLVRSPNLDRLAATGVTFDAAYCPSPLCVPSRAAFMTGKHLHRVGAYDNGAPFSSAEATWAHMLRAAGYEVVLDGKMHFIGPDALHGFERQLTRDSKGRIAGSAWLDPFPRGFRDGATTRRWVEEAGPGKRANLDFDDEVEAAALEYLREKGAETASPPWALCVGFLAPHFPLVVPEPYFSLYYPHNVDLPTIPPGHIESQHPAHERGRLAYDLYDYTEEQIRRCRAAYYGLVTHLDERIGRLLGALDATGQREDTVVVYTSDHGEFIGEHGLWWKNDFYEHSSRVPLIVSWPARFAAGRRCGGAVSLLDLTRTLIDLADAPDPGDLDGDSLLPVLHDPEGAAWKDEAFCEYYGHSTNRAQRMIRAGRWKLSYYHREPVELFDLARDPGEFTDLAGVPELAPIREALTRRVLAGWDPEAVERAVRRSHRHREIIGGLQFRVTARSAVEDAGGTVVSPSGS